MIHQALRTPHIPTPINRLLEASHSGVMIALQTAFIYQLGGASGV